MARINTPPLPVSLEARDHVLAVIRSSGEPLPAIALARLLVAPFQIGARQLAPLLEEYVADGKLHVVPPRTAKGKPRYWDRDPRAVGRAAALEAIEHAAGPLTAKELGKRLAVPLKFTESELVEILEQYVSAGRLHRLPPKTARGYPRYWNCNQLEFARMAILQAIDAKGPRTEAQLMKAAAGLSADQFQHVLKDAITARDIWRHPPLGKTKKELFGQTPPSPEPYLRDVANQLATVVARLTAASVSPNELRRALVQLIEAAGVPFSVAATSKNETAPAIDLIGLIRRIEPGADRGTLVGSRDLRRAARLDKVDFDRAVLELSRNGQLSLHRHDYATSLSPSERDELVTDGAGTYYVGMALRKA
jgi:hypothetical protein